MPIQLAHIRWRIDALDGWRDESDRRMALLESKVSDLRFTDAVAEQLAEKLSQQHRFQLTVLQKIGGGAFAVVLVVAPTLLARLLG